MITRSTLLSLACLSLFAAQALAQETRFARGAGGRDYVFTVDDTYPALGEAWREPDTGGRPGMIWGDVVIDSNEFPVMMDQREAFNHCLRMNPARARAAIRNALNDGRLPDRGVFLPRREDFIRLREYMGASGGTFANYTAQALPHLAEQYYWSSTPARRYGGAYAFDGRGGGITDYDRDHRGYAARCVGIR